MTHAPSSHVARPPAEPFSHRLADLLRRFMSNPGAKPARLDPDSLSDHLRRDLGLADGRASPRCGPAPERPAPFMPRL